MSEREPGWYWVQVKSRWSGEHPPGTPEVLYWDGSDWLVDGDRSIDGCWRDNRMAIIHEQRILAPGEPDPRGVFVRVHPYERIVIEAGPDGVWTESHEMTVPIGLSTIVDEDDAGLGQR